MTAEPVPLDTPDDHAQQQQERLDEAKRALSWSKTERAIALILEYLEEER